MGERAAAAGRRPSRCRCWALATGLLVVSPPAAAWGPVGHMVVAQIAYDRLSPPARREADRLVAVLAEGPQEHFVPASNWMDEIRGRGQRSLDHWHYTNPPYNPEGLAKLPVPDRHDVVWAIREAAETLRSPAAGDRERAWALRILLHLVGDVHQPLHAVNRHSRALPEGDRGGNLFPLDHPRTSNLHAYWDGAAELLPRQLPPGSWQSRVPELARAVLRALPEGGAGVEAAASVEPEVWAKESFELAVDVAYAGIGEGTRPTAAYRSRAQEVARRRLALAGLRLAALLEAALAK